MSDAEKFQAVIDWTMKRKRQNAHTRALRVDAQAALHGDACCAEATLQSWHRLFAPVDRMPVLRVDPSPMNPKRKLLTLACGHEVWSPRRKATARCEHCAKERA